MKKLLLLTLIILLSGCLSSQTTITTTTTSSTLASNPTLTVSVKTDKELYHSGQEMIVTVSVDSQANLDGALLNVHGINSKYDRLNKEQNVSVSMGTNTYNVTYTTPSCTGCAGILPGTYTVNASISWNQQLLGSALTQVEIQQ